MDADLERRIAELRALAAVDPRAHACDLAWAYSSLSNAYGQNDLPTKRIGACSAATALLQERVDSPTRTNQELRDFPLLLDNLATALLDAGRFRDAIRAAEHGIVAEYTAVSEGARNPDETASVVESLRDTRLKAELGLRL